MSTPTAPISTRWVNAFLLILLAYGLAMAAASFMPAGRIAGDLGQYSGGGDASAMIAARFAAVASRARLAGGVLCLLALAGATQRHRLATFLRLPRGTGVGSRAPANLAALMRARPWLMGALVLIMVAGLVLRQHYLSRPMRHDEAWTYLDYARMPLYAIPVRYSDVNDHVLNTLLIHIATAMFGNAAAIVRLPAFLFGLCVMPAGFLLARALAGARAGVIATALLASSAPLIEFSVNARGYEALTCFFLIILVAGHAALAGGRGAWAIVAIAGTLGLYTVPTMMVPLVAAFIWFGLLALRQNPAARWRQLADITAAGGAIVLAACLLYLPILIANGAGVLLNSRGIHSADGVNGALAFLPGYAARLMRHWTRGYGPVLGLLVPAMVPASLLFNGAARSNAPPGMPYGAAAPNNPASARTQLALLLAALAAAVVFQLVLLKDPGPFRIWLPFLAVFLVIAAIGIDGLVRTATRLIARPSAVDLAGPAAAAAIAAVSLCACIATGTLMSRVILTSDETAYYPPAATAADDLSGSTPADTIGITAVRSDEILYYALRHGIVLRPISTGAALRYFRRVAPAAAGATAGASVAAAPASLILLVDAAFDHCSGAACAALARPDVKMPALMTVLRDDPSLTYMRGRL